MFYGSIIVQMVVGELKIDVFDVFDGLERILKLFIQILFKKTSDLPFEI